MPTITFPKELIKDKNLIAIPSDIYHEFLVWQKKIKSTKTFKPTQAEKKALAQARKNLANGKYLALEELKNELDITHR